MGISDHLTCLLRNLYASQEATVRTGHGTTWNNRLVPNRKRSTSGCILSPCLFNFYAEYIMRNPRLKEAQAGIKIAGRNINNLRFADDSALMAESEEELKSLLMKVKVESSVQFSSVTQLCTTLCEPMNHSTPGLPVHHHLLEFTQTHIHLVSDAIQPSHPLSSSSPPAPNPSQQQSLFQ